MGGKRFADPDESGIDWGRINYKKVALVAVILVAIIALVVGSVYFVTHKEKKTEEKQTNASASDEKKMPKTYEGYDVLGQIVIEKIDLKEYILDSTENAAMDKAPVKLYGDKLNQEGNFCIAGHNYDEIFASLIELDVGDEFYIEDKEGNIQDYKITQVLEVEPTDLTPLMPVEDKIEVTLITCEKDVTERLVLKAERIDIEENDEESSDSEEKSNSEADSESEDSTNTVEE